MWLRSETTTTCAPHLSGWNSYQTRERRRRMKNLVTLIEAYEHSIS
jgi:hypothetical protein